MEILTNPYDLQARAKEWRCSGLRTALVPTMGYFHEGHLTLMDHGRKNADRLMVSLFVNPTQFGPGEDLDTYPRNAERDEALAREHGVDVLFTPTRDSMYAPDHDTWVEVPSLAAGLCGVSRPTFFRGVATVVTKLLILAMPDIAMFGEKDYQQLTLIKRMVRDLMLPTEIVGMPIVREADGLALSSRNAYLTETERAQAPQLYKGLAAARDRVAAGERDITVIRQYVESYYAKNLPLGELDYLEFVDPESLVPMTRADGPCRVAVALRLGKARLIDNLRIDPPSGRESEK